MTIEPLADSFREAKAKAGHPARIKYPKKLKDAAIEYFRENPKLTPSTKASLIGISTSYADKWFNSVKQAKAKDQIKIDPPSFVELKPKQASNRTLANDGELCVRIIEVRIPTALGKAELFSSLRAIVHGAVKCLCQRAKSKFFSIGIPLMVVGGWIDSLRWWTLSCI